MKRHLFLIAAWFSLTLVNIHAQEVRVYCKDGSIIQGQVISISKSALKIDPNGPITLRTLSASEVDSVVSLSGERRVRFPLDENADLPDFGRYHPTVRSPLTRKFSLAFYLGYRFSHTLQKVEIPDDFGRPISVAFKMDGQAGGGLMTSILWPNLGDSGYLEGIVDIGFWQESISAVVPGARLQQIAFRYLSIDLGLKPMFRVAGRAQKLFLSPFIGAGFRTTNTVNNPNDYIYNTLYGPQLNAEFEAFFGGSLDLLGSRKIASSLDVKFTNAKYYLSVNSFTVPTIRLTFRYVDDF